MTFQISGFRFQELLWVLSEEEMSCRQYEVTAVVSWLGMPLSLCYMCFFRDTLHGFVSVPDSNLRFTHFLGALKLFWSSSMICVDFLTTMTISNQLATKMDKIRSWILLATNHFQIHNVFVLCVFCITVLGRLPMTHWDITLLCLFRECLLMYVHVFEMVCVCTVL